MAKHLKSYGLVEAASEIFTLVSNLLNNTAYIHRQLHYLNTPGDIAMRDLPSDGLLYKRVSKQDLNDENTQKENGIYQIFDNSTGKVSYIQIQDERQTRLIINDSNLLAEFNDQLQELQDNLGNINDFIPTIPYNIIFTAFRGQILPTYRMTQGNIEIEHERACNDSLRKAAQYKLQAYQLLRNANSEL